MKQYLLSIGSGQAGVNTFLSPEKRLTLCAQVASALTYITEVSGGQGHGDVAARNVLLTPNLDAKLGISALSSDVYASEYFAVFGGKIISPRWIAPESVANNKRNASAADVWSFGVFVWEVFGNAHMPYDLFDDATVVATLLGRARMRVNGSVASATTTSSSSDAAGFGGVAMPSLSWPPGSVTSRDIDHLVDSCRQVRIDLRPSFREISAILGSMIVDSAL